MSQWLVALVAALIIVTAVLVGIGRLLIPYADELRPWLEIRLAEGLGEEVEIEHVEVRWPRLTPTITLVGVRAGSEDEPLAHVGRAILEMYLPDLLRADRSPFRLVVLGLDLAVVEDDSGRWGLRLERGGELGGGAQGSQSLGGELLIRDARVRVLPRERPALEMVLSEGVIRRNTERMELLADLHLALEPEAKLSLAARAGHADGSVDEVLGRAGIEGLSLDSTGLAALVPGGVELPPDRLEADLRFGWRRGQGSWSALDFGVTGDDDFSVSGQLRAERRDRRIDAQLVRLDSSGESVARDIVMAHDAGLWAADIPALDLAAVHGMLDRWLGGWQHWPTQLSGRLEAVTGLYRHPGSLHRLSGRVENFAFDLPDDRAAVSGIDAELGIVGDRASFTLSGSPVIDWPAKMRQPIPIEAISGRVIVSPGAVQLDGIAGRRPEAEARADGWVWLGGGRPFLDFLVEGDVIEPVDPRPWLPAGQIPPRALEWLDHALLGVAGANGGINYHFRLGHKFRNWFAGDFQAWIDFAGADLDFWPGWPQAQAMSGQVDFVGRSLSGRVERGELGQVEVTAERVLIPDLSRPELTLDLATVGARAEALRTLIASFPFENWSQFLEPLRGEGTLNLSTGLVLPVRDMPSWQLQGRAVFDDTVIALPQAGLAFSGVTGDVAFDRDGIAPARLQLGTGEDQWLSLEAAFGAEAWMSLDGRLSPARVLAPDARWRPLADRLSGVSDWRARLQRRESAEGWRLTLDSNLQGLESDLPEPLIKAADTAIELSVDLTSGQDGLALDASLAERLALSARQRAGQWQLTAGLGQPAPELPEGDDFAVAGSLDRLDLSAWSAELSRLPVAPTGSAPRGRASLSLDKLDYGGVSLEALELDLLRESNNWKLTLQGDSVSGDVTIPVPLDSGRVMAIDLQHLHLEELIDEESTDQLEAAPMPEQTDTQVPSDAPPMHLLIEDLSYRGLTLGRVRMESHSRRDGVEFERMEIDGPYLELSGYGRWITSDDGPITQFEGRLISLDFDPLLKSFGYETGLSVGRSQIELSGSWPGSPADFSLARLDGVLDLDMYDGNIPEARPGAGRLIGLVSISTIPRRLALDFRDVFSQGLAFDRIEGRFELASGVARTDGLSIDSPAADIEVSGATDMGARTYDQLIVVEPGVSNTLPIIGVLTGGPAGAAAGLILRSLLERPLQGIAEARYRVTGSWEDPQVELVETRAADLPDAADSAEDTPD
ncbi:hypothetical protein G4Y73_02070 [Wenzhouxiangella sp. XN201]|uniref:YhdP family phospholipid transporter n=1 Tax=Wenzhouxiangella sp. XN201 TaxID=2710755 RepID=UPI0013C5B1AE|nr:AsmA-like C-terminal region-containing protein [Wenzhouxiangella sp. XN201]NEZ02933.1 hypothetical protein [Wenzhouxiangella sp. XN201]